MISLKLGGNTDSIFALSVSLGRFFFVIFTDYERQDTETRRYTYMRKISGNKLLVKALREEGVDTLFGYPGACTIDISDELYKQDYTKVILPRQEVALVHEADAYARSTGKVGVCLVTSGPGATNLVTGLATAYYDSVPLVSGSRYCWYNQKYYQVWSHG